MNRLRERIARNGRDSGAYAILYAALVVVMVGFSSIVVDIASMREDRRTNKSAADSAVLGATEFLNPIKFGGRQPDKGCLRAWDYLVASIQGLTKPAAACSNFSPLAPASLNPATYCATATPALIRDERVVGDKTIIVVWPVPKDADENFLTPDVAPGEPSQTFFAKADGSAKGCDRMGVAVLERQTFTLAPGMDMGAIAGRTSVHSVAFFDSTKGPVDQVAALNILNPTDCEALVTTGNGTVVVGPTVDRFGVVKDPGIIAVESDANGVCSGSGYAIAPTTGSGSLVCASKTILNAAGTNCDGLGRILSHALDPGGNASRAYLPAAIPANLKPTPIAEGGRRGWNPVTALYGCYTTLSPCVPPADEPNYVEKFVTAMRGPGMPVSLYSESQSPYTNPYTLPFASAPASVCPGGPGITGTVVVPPGNWYVSCAINIASGGRLIFQGGNIVVDGAITISSGTPNGCLVVNVATTTCPTAASIVGAKTAFATTTPAPTDDATLFIRGNTCIGGKCGLNHAGDLVMPQTFVYAANAAKELNVASTGLTMWTAPGAGKLDADGRTTLEAECLDKSDPDPAKWTVEERCMNSRFARMVYWSDYASPKTKPNNFAGQGSMDVVGVFFTPTAYFNFTGGGSYTAAFAQFWADTLNVNGGAFLGLAPNVRTAIESPTGATALIR